jgi:predicted enzyme related to lactoylglutathione lyase
MPDTNEVRQVAGTPLRHLPGHFYFTDVHTTDIDGAASFYGDLLGWEFQEVAGDPYRYVVATIDGRSSAALTGLTEDQRAAGVAPHWFPYLYVADLDATVAAVPVHGGTVVAQPMDVFDLGRMAVAVDPTGAAFGIWQDADPAATTVKDALGAPFWYELHTSDVDAAIAFYGALVGWSFDTLQMGPDMAYHLIVPEQVDDQQGNAGGIMRQMQRDRDDGVASTWYSYFQVDDVDAAFARAQELGAGAVMEPHDIPGAGRACWITDPQGAYVALMRPEPPTSS